MRRVLAISLAILAVAWTAGGVVAQDAEQSVSDRLLEILKDRQVISPNEYGELKDLADRMEDENAELNQRLGDLDRSIADYMAKEGDEPTANLSYRKGQGFRFFSRDGLFELNVGGWFLFSYTYMEAQRGELFGGASPSMEPVARASSSSSCSGNDRLDPCKPTVWGGMRTNSFDVDSRLWFTGHAFTDALKFRFEFDIAPMLGEADDYDSSGYMIPTQFENFDAFQNGESNSGLQLLDAYVDYNYCDYTNFRFGQFKAPTGRQFLVHQSDLAFPWRHTAARVFELRRDVGAMMHDVREIDDDGMTYEYMFGVFNGEGKDASYNDNNSLAFSGRFGFYPFGYIPYAEGNADRDEGFKMGVAGWYGHHQTGIDRVIQNTYGARHKATVETWGLDMVATCHGFFLTGEYLDRRTDVRRKGGPVGGHQSSNDYGWFAQAGYKVTDDLELMARYGRGNFDVQWTPFFPAETRLQELIEYAFGATYYFDGHDLKVSLDVGRTKQNWKLMDDDYYQWLRIAFWLSW